MQQKNISNIKAPRKININIAHLYNMWYNISVLRSQIYEKS